MQESLRGSGLRGVMERQSLVVKAFRRTHTQASFVKEHRARFTDPKTWGGATKLVSNLGDTVISVALSEACTMFAAGGSDMARHKQGRVPGGWEQHAARTS